MSALPHTPHVHILKTLSDDHGLPTFLGQTADGEVVLVRELAPVLTADDATRRAIVERIGDICSVRHARLLPTTLIEDGARLRIMEPKPDTLTLADWLTACERLEMKPSPQAVLHVARGIGTALRCLHAFPSQSHPHQHVLHWAVHPANVHIQRDGGIMLGGFGLLPPLHRGVHLNTRQHAERFAFLAPEQTYSGQRLGQPTDLFSFGLVLLELITGVSPYEGHSVLETVTTTRRARWGALTATATSLSPELADVLPALLELNPKRRWQSATDFLEALGPSEAGGAERDALLGDIEHLFETQPTPQRPDYVPHLAMCPLRNGPRSTEEHVAQEPPATNQSPKPQPILTPEPSETPLGPTTLEPPPHGGESWVETEVDTLLDSLHEGICGEDDPTEEVVANATTVHATLQREPERLWTHERKTALMIGLYLGGLALVMGSLFLRWTGGV